MGKKYNKRILHIVNIPWYSGLGSYAEDMGYYMKKSGSQVTFAVPGDSSLLRRLSKNFKVIKIPGRDPLQTLRGLFILLKERKKFDAIISHSGSSFFIGFFMKIFNEKITLIRTRAERGCPNNNIFNRFLHGYAGAVVVSTEKIKRKFLSLGLPSEKILVISPPVDTEKFYPAPLPEENKIALVGRLSAVKGHEVLIKALPLIKKKLGKLKVVFAGKRKKVKLNRLMKKASRIGVRGDIEHRGFLPEEKVAELMRNSSAGVIASLGSEAVSRVALEWISSGRPLVASNVGCIWEYLSGSGAALIYQPGNVDQLAKAVVKILKDQKLKEEMAEKARRRTLEKFSPDVYMENLKKIYNIIK